MRDGAAMPVRLTWDRRLAYRPRVPDVVLINAPPYRIAEPTYDLPRFTRYGLACLAGYLEKFGISVAIIDAKFERLSYDETVRRALEMRPRIVGLTAFTNEIKPCATVAGMIKRERPEIVTVVGGVHVSALPEDTLSEFPCFDVGVVGEGEVTLYELWRALEERTSLSRVKGLVYRTRDCIVTTPPRGFVTNLDELAPVAWHLLPRAPEYLIMTTRGCPYACPFCMNPNGRIVRARTPESMFGEISMLVERYQPERFWVCDEIFGSHKANSTRLLDLLIESGLAPKLKLWCETHVRFASAEFFQKLKAAGFWQVGFGIESGDPEKLKWVKKGSDLKRITHTRKLLADAGLEAEGLFILGHAHETRRSAWATVNLATRLNLDLTAFGIMVPFPGTEVWELALKGEGGYKLISRDWNRYGKQVGGSALEFEHLTIRELKLIQIFGYIKVLLWNRRFGRFLKFVWHYRREGLTLLNEIFARRAAERDKAPPWTDTSATYIMAAEDPLRLELTGRSG
jgi:radical SAM superfamily enzyme YgiQ (UPF0313 family)